MVATLGVVAALAALLVGERVTVEETGGAIRALAAGHDALWVGAPAGLIRGDVAALP